MRHAQVHAENRARERRRRLAIEAARLISEGGIRDYGLAKRKAAQRLGIGDEPSLPRNSEIDDALREHQRLFRADQPDALRRRREAAIEAMEFFAGFHPRLVGAVLEGSADDHSAVCLHLFCDEPETFARFLAEHRIPAHPASRTLRLDRSRSAEFPVWLFSAGEVAFDVTVLPEVLRRQAPLDRGGEKPMRRAGLGELRALIAAEGG